VTIPWCACRKCGSCPEFYEGLHAYSSWTALLTRFLRDPDVTLFSAIVRPTREHALPERD